MALTFSSQLTQARPHTAPACVRGSRGSRLFGDADCSLGCNVKEFCSLHPGFQGCKLSVQARQQKTRDRDGNNRWIARIIKSGGSMSTEFEEEKGEREQSDQLIPEADADMVVSRLEPEREPVSGIERLELQAKTSIAKLKHILYRLKTRPMDVSSTLTKTAARTEQGESTTLEDSKEVFVSQRIEIDMKAQSNDADKNTSSLLREIDGDSRKSLLEGVDCITDSDEHLDSLTCTRTTVNFDEVSQTAVVTVTATVRAMELEDEAGYVDRTVALAARALARTCLVLDERAQVAARQSGSISKVLTSPSGTEREKSIASLLENGKIKWWKAARVEFGSSPFRNIFEVGVTGEDGDEVEALFKEVVPGDSHSRWKRAPADWVAFQISSLLDINAVPPAVLRNDMKIGERVFKSGVLVALPKSLKKAGAADFQGNLQKSLAAVTNIHILDAVLGNVARQPRHFFAAKLFTDEEGLRPISMQQPEGPYRGGAIHSMWTSRHGSGEGIKTISSSVHARLKSLNKALLLETFNGALSSEEMDMILEKRSQVIAYFDFMAARHGHSQVVV